MEDLADHMVDLADHMVDLEGLTLDLEDLTLDLEAHMGHLDHLVVHMDMDKDTDMDMDLEDIVEADFAVKFFNNFCWEAFIISFTISYKDTL